MIFNKSINKGSFEEDSKSEKPIRSVVKAISWRIVGTIDTLVISFFITQKIALAASIASLEIMTKMVLYFFHERVWNNVKWGK